MSATIIPSAVNSAFGSLGPMLGSLSTSLSTKRKKFNEEMESTKKFMRHEWERIRVECFK